jgi:hypothetical protein
MLLAWKGFSFKEMVDIAFHYKFLLAMKFLARYSLISAKHKVKSLVTRRHSHA